MPNRITLHTIAEAANVSVATVSKALNDTGQLSAHTRRVVLNTAKELGYEKSKGAIALRHQSGLIGLVSADLEGRFSMPALIGAENTLGASNHAVLLTNSRGDPKLERAHIDQLAARGVDGLLILGGETDSRPPVKPNTALGIPIVYAYAPSNDPDDCSVTCDNTAAGAAAINHLIDRGCSRIAIISGPEHYLATKERIDGAMAALRKSGMRPAAPTRYGNWHESWGRTAARLLLDSGARFDGIYCLNDMLARGAIETLLARGLKVPQDVAVVGHDNWAVTATECQVPITSFDNNLQEIGRRAARLLLDSIRGNRHRGVMKIGCSLIVRESTLTKPR
ncbi:LacI family transcriptional regulator [Bifidobacterium lemurum]|uniref:LacI family transcriptional regulator n=1 Tax=Bifidobacterium lemurum TaxID=1603886 RepID=A0A261FTZ3_9BIFI|nr:LacI family DNA-binding transcriptional regulator [Bifidobacterium lemurum]OZG62649.1 LacI family transcriptional regulator [Bifidobacterium lemurum]QOL34629.1 LacI family DNA-binding transcriptional regulator [Bifidobacterium lemurum]